MPRNLIAMLTVVLSTILTVSCDAGISTQEHLQRAQKLQSEKDFRAAIIEYKAALQNEPANAEARWELGKTYLTLGDGPSAEKELRNAQKHGKQGDEVVIALARALLIQGEYQKSLDTLQEASQLTSSADGTTIQGEAYLGLQKVEEAKKSFLASLKLDNKNAEAYRGLAKVALIEKDLGEADRQLDQSLALSNRDTQSWMLKGEIALSKQDPARAEEYFSKALQIDDNSFGTRVGLTRALLEQNKTEEAREHLDFLTKNLPDNPLVNYLLAVAAKQNNELTQAKDALLHVRNVQPNHLPSMLLLGSIHYLLKEYDPAIQELRRYLAADEDSLPARKLLAAAELKLNSPDEAIEALTPAEKSHPGDIQLLVLLGNAHIAKRDFSLGMAYLEKASALAPEAKDIRLQIASGRIAMGDSEKALAELNSAVASDPDFLQAEIMLVLIHLNRREFDKALEHAGELIAKKPASPLPHNLMAAAYEGIKDMAQARASYVKALQAASDYTPAMLNLARMDLQVNDREGAKQRFQDVLNVDEHNPRALLGLASIARDEKRFDDAIQLLDRARWHNPDALQPRLILAEYYLRRGEARKALEPIGEAAKLAPNNPRVLELLGQSQLRSGEQKAGLSTYEKLSELDSESPDTHVQYSVAQLANKDLKGAKQSLQKAIALDGKHVGAQLALGTLELQTGNLQTAEQIAGNLRKQHPKNSAGYVLQGDLHLRQKQTAKAVSAYKTAYALSPNRTVLLKLFNAERAAGNQPRAIEHLRSWIDAHPNDLGIRIALAQALFKAGRMEGAAQEYERALEIQPSNLIALNNLASIYIDSNKARAVKLAKLAYDQAPHRADVQDTYGWVLVSAGETERGLRLLKSATLGAPNNLDIRYHLAAARVQVGESNQARKDLRAILVDDTPFAERENAIALLRELGDQ